MNDRDTIPDTEWLLVLLVVRRPREEAITSKYDTLHVLRSSLLSESTAKLKEYQCLEDREWCGVMLSQLIHCSVVGSVELIYSQQGSVAGSVIASKEWLYTTSVIKDKN